ADQGDKTDPPGDVAEGRGQTQVGDDQCQYTAEGEFPQAGAGVEVGPHGIVRGDPQRVGERTGQDGTHGHQRGATYRQAESERHQSGDRDEDRPEQVELPLDGQGPEVLYGTGRGVVGHVVDRTKGKVPVAVVQRGGLNLGDDVDPSRSWQEQV